MATTRRRIADGICDAYEKTNLRYSQLAPLDMFEEKNTGDQPAGADRDLRRGRGRYKFLFIAKGGGSANKTFLFQETPSLLTHDRLLAFLKEKIADARHGGLPALSPGDRHRRHLGRTDTLKTVKLASARYLDDAADRGQRARAQAFRDLEMEARGARS